MKPLHGVLLILFLPQFLSSGWAADETVPVPIPDTKEEAATETQPSAPQIEEYDVSDTIKRGKQIIQNQKEQLAHKELPKEETQKITEEETVEIRREAYQQQIIQEVERPSPMTALENELMAERFRQELMVERDKDFIQPAAFKKHKFNLRVSETCDDNIYLDKIDTKKDYISKISPSFLFSMGSKRIMIDANYAAEYTYYANDKNKKQDGFSHLLFTYIRPGTASLPFLRGRGGRFGIEVQNMFQPRITSIAGSDQTSRTKRKYNRLFIPLDYYMTRKLTLSLEYTNEYQRYIKPEDKPNGYNDNKISPKIFFHIRPKWSLFTAYAYGLRDYPKFGATDANSNYHQLSAGITGKLLKKVRSRLEIGREWRKWKSSTYGKASDIFFKAALLDQFNPSTKGALQYNHAFQAATSPSQTTPYFISDSLDVNLDHKLTHRITGLLGFEYTGNKYKREEAEGNNTRKRRDKTISPQAGLRYYFNRDFSADLYYTYTKRTSNFSRNDYTDSKVTVGLNAPF